MQSKWPAVRRLHIHSSAHARRRASPGSKNGLKARGQSQGRARERRRAGKEPGCRLEELEQVPERFRSEAVLKVVAGFPPALETKNIGGRD